MTHLLKPLLIALLIPFVIGCGNKKGKNKTAHIDSSCIIIKNKASGLMDTAFEKGMRFAVEHKWDSFIYYKGRYNALYELKYSK